MQTVDEKFNTFKYFGITHSVLAYIVFDSDCYSLDCVQTFVSRNLAHTVNHAYCVDNKYCSMLFFPVCEWNKRHRDTLMF